MAQQLLTADDAERLLPMADAVSRIKETFEEHANGTLHSQPRSSFDTDSGSLVFTPGESKRLDAMGTRLSGKFTTGDEDADFDVVTPVKTDLVVVFDTETGALEGAVEGNRIPDMRTGAIGAVAIDEMARENATTLGIIGTGRQARTQLEGAATVRDFDEVWVFSRSPENRREYVDEMSPRVGLDVTATESAEAAVADADVVVSATSSPEPVLERGWLAPGTHVNSIGPMWSDAHELPWDVVESADPIVTDSREQVETYGDRFLFAGTDHWDRTVELGDAVTGSVDVRVPDDGLSLFCPMGLAGTEMVLAAEVLRRENAE
jgi:ornithine cyclodeaminase/alanine dehydrogenase-like protein (mu-crystallin family)